MPASVVLKALGLNTQPNRISLPDGSLTEASNVVIRRDNVVESRRGFKLDGDTFGGSTERLKQLMTYKTRILRHYSNVLQFEDGINNDGSRKFTSFNGTYNEPDAGLRIKSIEANGNFYFTTDQGIKKISADSATKLSNSSGYITQSGGVKAIDLDATLNITDANQNGFLTQDGAVTYRAVWGTKDANSNLLLGTPSPPTQVYNYLTPLMLRDFMSLLGALDDVANSGLITNDNYVRTYGLGQNSTASELQANLLALAPVIDADILYANDSGSGAPLNISSIARSGSVITVTMSLGTVTDYISTGDLIYVTNCVVSGGSTNASIDGAHVVTGTSSTTFTFGTTTDGTSFDKTNTTITSYQYRNITTTANGVDFPTSLTDLVLATSPTHIQLATIQDTISRMMIRLNVESNGVISSAAKTLYTAGLDVTTSANVDLEINIPADITSNHFLQVYRSSVAQSIGTSILGDTVTPNDELSLIYEAYPTSAQLLAKVIDFTDITTDAFRGAFLYSNEATGEGAAQTNDIPPLAKDINYFKNVTFFANTKTRQRQLISLLGVTNMVLDYNNGTTPKIVISNSTVHNSYTFVTGLQETTRITCAGNVSDSLDGKYFLINSANDKRQYYVWYKSDVAADPAVSGKTGIRVVLDHTESATEVATKTRDTISRYIYDFTTTNPSSTVVQVVNFDVGYTTDASAGTSAFSISITVQGRGENATNKEILLSADVSPAIAVDETARSLSRIVNKNSSEIVYSYYLSDSTSVPGKLVFEGRTLSSDPFYILANNVNTGSSFNPDFSPTLAISSIATGAPGANLITTSTAHGLTDGDKVVLCDTTTTPVVDGLYTISYVSTTTFRINATITVGDASTAGVAIRAVDAEVSDNETQPHRIYYSKKDQPEAVPLLNYFDVGASDKEILRIFPLRDSLFVFKEDGLFRISGTLAPFTLALFDSSFTLLAPDSLALVSGVIYGWTNQGVSTVNEASTKPAISRPIDIDILKTATAQYTNFSTATFGVGYESDNSYLVWTVKKPEDDDATICYRFSTLTNTWTTYDKTNTCGVVNNVDDKLYLGCGDTNSMESERKNFSRYDYSDREYNINLSSGNYLNNILKFTDTTNITIGDVLVQTQTLNIYDFNILLKQLDVDTGVNDTNYYSTLAAIAGDDMRLKLVALAAKLDADTGVTDTNYSAVIDNLTGNISSLSIASPSVITASSSHGLVTNRYVTLAGTDTSASTIGDFTVTVLSSTTFSVPVNVKIITTGTGTFVTKINDFQDIKACYNIIVNKLNSDSTVSFNNYQILDNDTTQEAIVLSVNKNTGEVTLDKTLDFIVGQIVVFKAIETEIEYAPQTMHDPLGLKHIREATMIFDNKAFTNAILSFSTDLLPSYVPVPFNGDGNGIFGNATFGKGFFGGGSNGAPFRTYVPRNCQRCRYIQLKFNHKIAREQYAINGVTLTGEVSQSPRAYR